MPRKKGYASYVDQCEKLWMMCVIDFLTITNVCSILSINRNQVNTSLKHWAELTNQQDVLYEYRYKSKSIASKTIRRNITQEQESYRISKVKSATYTKRRDISGDKNPRKINWKDSPEIMCPVCKKVKQDSPAFRRWHFNNCKI